MKLRINHKMIKEKCGSVSFKRGDAFYRSQKVNIVENDSDHCRAVVRGAENFYVVIEKGPDGEFAAECTCPKLASYQKDCQHIAAVLIAVYELEKTGTEERASFEKTHSIPSPNSHPANDFLRIFEVSSTRSSAQQHHFENRQVLPVEFICLPIIDNNDENRMGVKIKVDSFDVIALHPFLMSFYQGQSYKLTETFIYDPNLFCFEKETDRVLQLLAKIVQDGKVAGDKVSDILIIPSSNWSDFISVLSESPSVIFENDQKKCQGIPLATGKLPLQFEFIGDQQGTYELRVHGLSRICVFPAYHTVLASDHLFQLGRDDFQRLMEIITMIKSNGRNALPIAESQIAFFIEKVVPGLKKLGEVLIDSSISERLNGAPLSAKLYLDRVNNRLLAGLEFHYEHISFNPLDAREQLAASKVIRDEKKENQILQFMEESSFAITDSGYFLQNDELEYEFLTKMVPKLENLVQIYATTAVRNRIFRGNSFPKINVRVKKERTNWLEFTFEMDGIPEKEIKEILQALVEKRKFYRLRNGALFSLEAREWAEIARFLKTNPLQEEDITAQWDVPIVRGIQEVLASRQISLPFHYEDSFRKLLDTLQYPEQAGYEVPKVLMPILHEYQIHGYKWLKTLAHYGFGGILADDMGLGKTVQSIAFIVSELENIRLKKQPVFIVCPSSLTYNWLSELMKFAPHVRAIVIDGDRRERASLLQECSSLDVVISSYPLLRSDLHAYEKQIFHTVFFDEAQYFKNPLTKTARAVKKIHAKHRFALTGTPLENSLEELWSIFHVVFPELFQGLKEFSQLNRAAISRRARPFMLRRIKEDVLSELPEKTDSLEKVELFPEQKKLYTAYLSKLRHDAFKHLDKDTFRKNKIKILAGLTRLRQICCHPALFVAGYQGGSAKFKQLMEIVEQSRKAGRRMIIFSQFTKMLELISRELAIRGDDFYYLDGGTPASERLKLCQQFNAGGSNYFLISLKAGGTGLNLTGADTVILYDSWWNPAVEDQAADRVHRIGQTKQVEVIKLVARGTIEEKMNELQAKKRELIEEMVGPEKQAAATLSEEDIKELFNL